MARPKQSAFIASPMYDSIFFILSPILALLLGIYISATPIGTHRTTIFGKVETLPQFFIGTFILAHLVIVFFRSHLNLNIFRRYPIRFTVVPVALLIAMSVSAWIAVIVTVLTTWWDVYHSSLQTFGLGRIYDMKEGNSAEVGRRLDYGLNLLLYAGPILAGATLMDHVKSFSEFERVGSAFFTSIPAEVNSHRRYLAWLVLTLGFPYLTYYAFRYWQFYRQGYKVSVQKVVLLISTGSCSIYTWGFNSFGQAFFIMNFFHALQYFAIVWWMERENIAASLRVQKFAWGKALALAVLLFIGFDYGFWGELQEGNYSFAANLINVIAIMHFWYDGFIWSVRLKMV